MAAVGGPGPPDPLGYGKTQLRQTPNVRQATTNADDFEPSGDHAHRFGDHSERTHAPHRTSYSRAQDQQFLLDQDKSLRQNASESRHSESADRAEIKRSMFGQARGAAAKGKAMCKGKANYMASDLPSTKAHGCARGSHG